MNKLCCCEPELPEISVNVTCACCDSHVEEHARKDETDSSISEEPQVEENVDTVCCGCFKRTRQAKLKKKNKKCENGASS